MEHPFTWWSIIPGLEHVPNHFIGSAFTGAVLIGVAVMVGGHFKNVRAALVPPGEFGLVSVFDAVFSGLFGFMEGIIGPRYKEFFPLIGTLALFILFSNLQGFVPGLLPPTENINVPAACALIVFVIYNYYGIRAQGFVNYMKHLAGPVWWLAPLLFPIELISHCARPLSLALRLFANIFADHILLGIFMSMVPWIVPSGLMLLGLLVAFVQAAVFSILAMVYIAMAIEVHEDHGHAGHEGGHAHAH